MILTIKNKSEKQIIVLALLLSVISLFIGCTKKKSDVYHIGILSGLNYIADAADGFKTKMTELGYVENKNIVYDLYRTDFDEHVYRKTLNKFVSDKVDLIFVFPTEASQEAKAATKGTNIPVIFSIANIEETGLVKSAGEPGGNITGVRYPGPDIALQRLEVLCELVPQAKHIFLPYQRNYPIVASQLDILYPAASSMGVILHEGPADNASELKTLLDAHVKSDSVDIDAILFLAEPLSVTPDAFIVMCKFASEYKIPVAGALMEIENYSTLFGINIDIFTTGKQAAILADKILKGTPAGSIPVVSAKPYFQLNYKLAQEMGIHVSESLLSRANEIIH